MIIHLFAITTVGLFLFNSIRFFRASARRKRALKKMYSGEILEIEKRHNSIHFAGVALMFFCGIFLFVSYGLIIIGIMYGYQPDPILKEFAIGMFGTLMIANNWYLNHLIQEERGRYDIDHHCDTIRPTKE